MMFVIVVQMPEFTSTTITSFPERSYSAASGFEPGDKIVKFNNYSINNTQDLSFAIATTKLTDAKGDTLAVFKQDCNNRLTDFYSEIYSDNSKNDSERVQNALKVLDKAVVEINKSKTKAEADSLYNRYYEELANAGNVKKYTVPAIEVKKIRKRFQSDAEVIRNGERITLKDVQLYTYTTTDKPDEPQVGIDFYLKSEEKTFGSVLTETGSRTVSVVRMVWSSLCGLVTGQFTFKDISGPVGATSAIVQVASQGLENSFGDAVNSILFVMMMITINLGIFNMLPFPALDGGRFLFLLIEWIFRKPIPRKVESVVNGVGLGILLLFMAVITVKDVWVLLPFGG
jgi:regulator of sigma E protease